MMNSFKRIAKFLHRNLTIKGAGGAVSVVVNQSIPNGSELRASTKDTLGTGTEVIVKSQVAGANAAIFEICLENADKFRLDGRGILAVGTNEVPSAVTTSAWDSTYKGYVVGDDEMSFVGVSGTRVVGMNCYYDGTNWRARVAGKADLILSDSSGLRMFHSLSVGANAVVNSFTNPYFRINDNELTLGENLYTVNFFARTSSGLSPSASSDGNDFQAFLNRVTNILCANGDDNTYIWNNSYFDGTNIRSLVANAGVQLTMGWNGWSVNTFPVVAAGAVVTPTSRDGQPIVGKQWTDLTASRALGTIYQNVTGYEIDISVCVLFGAAGDCTLEVDTVTPPLVDVMRNNGNTWRHTFTATIPNLAYYRITATDSSLTFWSEKR